MPPLDPGVPLGDLIPPTELSYTPPEFEPVGIPTTNHPVGRHRTPDNPTGVVARRIVNERGLPARGGEQPGSGEFADGNGTNNSDTSETNTGTIVCRRS